MKAKLYITSLVLFLFLSTTQNVRGQRSDSTFRKNEISINFSKMLLLVRSSESFNLNYKRHFAKYALRFGSNFEFGTNAATGETEIDIRVGIERKIPDNKWQYFYGLDVNFSRQSYQFKPDYINTFGPAPLFGVRYFISDRFSLSTALKFRIDYQTVRDPDSFDPEADTNEWDLRFSEIGNVLVNFQF